MDKLFCLFCLIALAAADHLTASERNDILRYHNDLRSSVKPTASDMMKLVGLQHCLSLNMYHLKLTVLFYFVKFTSFTKTNLKWH